MAGGFESAVEFLSHNERKEAAEDVSAYGFIALMVNGSCLKNGFHVPECVLHHPELFVFQGYVLGIEGGVGPEDPYAVKASFLLELLHVDGNASALHLDESAVALVADHALGTALDFFLERFDDGLPVLRILSRLLGVEAYDVAPVLHPYLFDLQWRGVFGRCTLGVDLDVLARRREDLLAHLLDIAHSLPENVSDLVFRPLKDVESLPADHSPVRHDAKPDRVKSVADALHNGNSRFDVRRIPRPHLTTKRRAIIVEHNPDNHLVEVGAVILAKTPFPEFLSALSLEVDRGCVQEYQIERAEKVAVVGEHCLFYSILRASGRKRGCVRLVLDLLAQECHGPVEMVKAEVIYSLDEVVPAPLVAESIRTAHDKPVQDCEKECPLHVEPKQPSCKGSFEDLLYPQLLPKSFEDKDWTDLFGLDTDLGLTRKYKEHFFGKPGKRPHQGLDVPLLLHPVEQIG